MVIGSLDCDAIANTEFIDEALRFASEEFDILVFASRHLQQPLYDIVSQQKPNARGIALRVVLGIEWFKFQLREILYLIGANETRGSSGFFLKPRIYELLGGHQQPFNEFGQPLSGESNVLGIKAMRIGCKTKVSHYLTLMSPRRFVKAIAEVSSIQGYAKDILSAKLFTAQTQYEMPPPLLSPRNWSEFCRRSILGALNMVLTRATCYGRTDLIRNLLPDNPYWDQLVDEFSSFLRIYAANDDLTVIGNGSFNDAFQAAINSLSKNEVQELILTVDRLIPDEERLMAWSHSFITHPHLEWPTLRQVP
jgi:hypothetical protein